MGKFKDGTVVNGLLYVLGKIVGESFEISGNGLSVTYINKTGLDPETQETQGVAVVIDATTDEAVSIAGANSELCAGVIRDSGVIADADIQIVMQGKALGLLKDGVGCVKGEIAYVSDTAGRLASTSSPSTAGYKAVGKWNETKAGGTNVLAKLLVQKL